MKLTISSAQVLSILVILLFNSNSFSQEWESIGPSSGEMFTCLHLNRTNNTLFAGTIEGFWYGNLETNEWTSQIEPGWIGREVWSITSYPEVPARVITGRVNAWFKGYMEISDDWGVTNSVTFFSDGGKMKDLKFCPSQPNVMYACGWSDITPGDLLKSIDGGQSWSQSTNYLHTAMTSIAVSPYSPDLVYVSGDALVTKTEDGGATWSQAANGLPPDLGVYCVAMNRSDISSLICSNDNGLYRSTDGGENWNMVYSESCDRIVYNPVTTDLVAAITLNTSQILLSYDNGETWLDITGNFPVEDYLIDIEFSEDGTLLYTSSYYDIYSSEIIISGIEDNSLNKSFLLQNAPNPFVNSTTINFYLDLSQKVELEVFDLFGNRIRTLKSTNLVKGEHSVVWNGKAYNGCEVNSGIYVLRLSLENEMEIVKRMIKY